MIKSKGRHRDHARRFRQPVLPDDMIKSILAEYKSHNCGVILGEPGLTVDYLIDVVQGN